MPPFVGPNHLKKQNACHYLRTNIPSSVSSSSMRKRITSLCLSVIISMTYMRRSWGRRKYRIIIIFFFLLQPFYYSLYWSSVSRHQETLHEWERGRNYSIDLIHQSLSSLVRHSSQSLWTMGSDLSEVISSKSPPCLLIIHDTVHRVDQSFML